MDFSVQETPDRRAAWEAPLKRAVTLFVNASGRWGLSYPDIISIIVYIFFNLSDHPRPDYSMFVKVWSYQKNRNQSRSYKNTSRFQHVKLKYDAAFLIKSMVK